MVNIKQHIFGAFVYTDIYLTRGDDAVIVLPLFSVSVDGTITEYEPTVSDALAVTVSDAQITGTGTTPAVVISGTVSISGSNLLWEISSTDSTIDCRDYFWNVQITTDDGVFTIYKGRFFVLPK